LVERARRVVFIQKSKSHPKRSDDLEDEDEDEDASSRVTAEDAWLFPLVGTVLGLERAGF